MNSLENQTSFFNDYIQRNPEWEFVAIYTDEGVTGTSVKNRVEFNRMIQDAKDGKIDLIVTKEVSRFARNTVDTLSYTRELRRINVGVFFINDNINTMDSDGEFRLSIMASVAQEESRKTSNRVKWGMRRQMEKGFTFAPPMIGYDSADGKLTINKEEAEVVKKIYDMYVRQKLGTCMIAKQLAAENTPLYKRIKRWTPELINRILKNEKYCGDLIQQKTMVVDYLTHRSVKNAGEKIVFSNHHEPIVDRSIWDEAQEILKFRSSSQTIPNPSVHTNRYWCSGKIQCGTCGGPCVTKTKKAQYGVIRCYRCKHTTYYENGKGACTNTSYTDERILCACMQYAIAKLSLDVQTIKDQIKDAYTLISVDQSISDSIKTLESKKALLIQRKKKMLELLADGVISTDDFKLMIIDIDNDLLKCESELEVLIKKSNNAKKDMNKLSELYEYIDLYLLNNQNTTELYSEILEKMVIHEDGEIDVYLLGLQEPLKIKYTRSGRGDKYSVTCYDA